MAKKLVILESPSKAKTVSKILGSEYKVVASAGHLRDLPTSSLGVDIQNDFKPLYLNSKEKSLLIMDLKKDAKTSDFVYLATDPDREGEAISWHLTQILGIDPNSVCRVTFNEITDNAVKEGMKTPRCLDMQLVDAYQARRILDRLVGYQISPILWAKVKKNLSAGRVQSVAVRLICDREEEIEKFIAQEYWTIEGKASKSDDSTSPFKIEYYGKNGKKAAPENGEEANEIVNNVTGKNLTVTDVKISEKKQSPYAPFTTSTLQQDAAHKLSLSPRDTMRTAQQLYEGVELGALGSTGLVTYIRTDSVRISDVAQAAAADYIKQNFGANYLPLKKRFYKNKGNAQDAHEAIRPAHIDLTPDKVKAYLEPRQYKLYKLIFDRFIASQMADCVYGVSSVTSEVDNYIFKSTGRTVKFRGFTAAYDSSFGDDENGESRDLPKISVGEVLKINNIDALQHFTQPPARYNEASLVKTLEELGIGRPSTYATIISTICDKDYVVKEKKVLFPTDIGKVVNGVMKAGFPDIVNTKFTAEMEEKLDSIAKGDLEWVQVLKDFYGPFETELKAAETNIEKQKVPEKESEEVCPNCGKNLVFKTSKYGEFLACPGFPNCKYIKNIVESVGVNCPECGKELVYKKSKAGRKFVGCSGYPECNFAVASKPTGEKCPKCGGYLLYKKYKNRQYIGCSTPKCDYKPEKK